MSRKAPDIRVAAEKLLEFALGFPEAWLDHPWGENAVKVKKKVFLFLGRPKEGLSFSCKLPDSNFEALLLPFTEPTGYGLAKSGWVTANFREGDQPPLGLLCSWIEESYCAVAPKTLLKALEADSSGEPSGRRKKA